MSTNYFWKTPRIECLLPTGVTYVLEASDEDPVVHVGCAHITSFTWCQEPSHRAAFRVSIDRGHRCWR